MNKMYSIWKNLHEPKINSLELSSPLIYDNETYTNQNKYRKLDPRNLDIRNDKESNSKFHSVS